jgi:Glycosyl hydrolase family 47
MLTLPRHGAPGKQCAKDYLISLLLTFCLLKPYMTLVISSGTVIFTNSSRFRLKIGKYHMYRPETIESLFIAFRLTGDKRYRNDGWRIFQSIQKHCRVGTGGYASILNVDQNPAEQEDKMETFLMVRGLLLIRSSTLLTMLQLAERDFEVSLSSVL